MMSKATYRQFFLEKRKLLSTMDVYNRSLLIADRFVKNFITTDITSVHTFLPIEERNEVYTWFIIHEINMHYKHIQLICPVVNTENKSMRHALLTPNTPIRINSYGIPEPETQITFTDVPDIVLVPLVAIDKYGNRLGYGKGYYDRFLSTIDRSCLKIALSLEEPIEYLMHDHHDVPMDYCITPSCIYKYSL
ncbi:MAG: 5-formyltetrahydrofolate cyclo-ligase [Cytophagaceae bacterium]|nr:5-formyltetrahydrofolate cyclo-ligase [Cytophagaceae bacterium]MDW8455394.1 5-formyltetrahydrofolate cyclo-ligase [Cytophagaceae bacterium]